MRPLMRRGVALVLVLWVVVILGGLGTVVAREARSTTGLARNVRAGAVARHAAESGIEATVASIEALLASSGDSITRAASLNALPARARDSIVLGDGIARVSVIDPSTRLDVNEAPEANLARLLSRFGALPEASATARSIRRWIERPIPSSETRGAAAYPAARFVTPLRSLEELRTIPGVDQSLLERAAPYLTIDGDATVNVAMASDTVLDAAFGEHRLAPSRLLLVSRGWQSAHPLTHEIQATFAISNDRLVLVHWREQVR